MIDLNCQAQFKRKERLNKVSAWLSCGFFAASILLFWLGLDFLKTEAFPHYYNPQKHAIVQQNPDTKEIYAWKNAAGQVFTTEDKQVKNFTWGTTALLLLVMILGAYGHNSAMSYFIKILFDEPKTRDSYVPKLQ